MRTLGFVTLLSLVAALGCNRSPQYYLEAGDKFFAAGKYQDASLQYRKALQKNPASGEAFYKLGLVELEQNAFPQAYQWLARAVDALPANEDAKIKLANACLGLYVSSPAHPEALYNQVAKTSDQILAKKPNSFDGFRLKGSLSLLDQKPKAAIEYFRKANQIEPMQHDVILGFTQALFLDNQSQEGERLALDLIRREPGFGPIYDVLYRQYRAANRLADGENILKTKVSGNPAQAEYVVQLAQHYARVQKPSEIAATLQHLLGDTKRFPQGHLKAGDFYASVGNWPEAVRIFEEGAGKNPKEKLVYQKRIVDALLAQGKRAEAAQLVESVLKDNPKDGEFRRVRATLRMESGKPEDLNTAATEFADLVKEFPKDAALRFHFGRCLLAQGDLGRAQNEFQEAVKAHNDYVPALSALAELTLRQQKPDDALRYVQQVIAYDPGNAQAMLLGVTSLTALGRYNEAHAALAGLQSQFPNNPVIQLQFALLAIAEKKYQEAERILQRLYSPGQSDPRPVAAMAAIYTAQQQFEKAIQLLQDDLKKSPDSPVIRGLLADAAMRAGKYDVAIGAYRELLSKNPKSLELHLRLAVVYQTKGDHNSAIAILQEAQQLAPKDPQPAVLLAISLQTANRTDEAKANYQRALQLQPESPAVLNNLAYLLAENGGSLDEALSLVNRAIQKAPGQPNYRDTLGWIYVKKKMTDSAIQTFNSLVLQQPKNATYHYHLGYALLEKGDTVKAKRELENALANQPSPEQAARIKELIARIG